MTDVPHIQYARTSDGVNIAYVAEGTGPLVIDMMTAMPFSAVQALEISESSRVFYEARRQRARTVFFEPRGMGYSDRNVDDFSVDAMVRDVEAVVARTHNGEDLWLLAGSTSTPVAIAYAARNPGRVARFALWLPFSCGADINTGEWHGFIELAERDWDTACQTLPLALNAWSDLEGAKEGAENIKRSITPATYSAIANEMQRWDVRADLEMIQCPTLVMHRREFKYMHLDGARRVAAAIPGATFKAFDGASALPDSDVVVTLLNFATGTAKEEDVADALASLTVASEEPGLRSNTLTVLFTDLVGHTEMMSRLGDEKGRDVLREHERITREVLAANEGTEVKTMGDGFMASFGSVTRAVECAVALQRKFEVRREKLEVEDLSVRVGLNAGEPIEEDGDLFGATVILASRIAGKAEGGEILVADTVRGLCSGKGFLFSDRGEFKAKGFDEAVRVYEVRWRD